VVVTLKRPLTTPGRVDPKVYDPSNKTNPFGVTNPPAGAFIAAFDKNTGALRWKQAMHDSHKDASGKTVGMSGVTATADPVIYGNRVYAAIANETGLLRIPAAGDSPYSDFYFRGKVTCYNLADGKVIWTRYTISDELYKRTADGTRYSGAGIWGTPVVDPARNLLYVATGNNTSATTDDINAGRFPTAAEGNNVDSVMALKLDTGEVAWATSTQKGDRDVYQGGITAFAPVTADADGAPVRNAAGAIPIKKVALPPQVPAKDFDLGAALNVYDVKTSTGTRRIVGAGSKSGMYHAMDPDTGEVLWKTQAGPGGILGGIHWSGAVDDSRIYVSVNNSLKPWPLQGGEEGGGWTAMNAATGEIEWHTADPLGALTATGTGGALVSQHYRPIGASVYPTLAGGKNIWVGTDSPATVANGVVFVGTGDMEFQRDGDQVKLVDNFPIPIPGKGGHMYALDARTGAQLWSFESGSSVYGGAAIKDGVVYWGTGYPRFGQNPVNIKRDKQGQPILQDGQPTPTGNGPGGFGGAGYLFAFEPKK
jgi:polyvinyl alcohol dehydrogenase (cytochrome)